ncbi:hypothetical protein ULF88_06600 [Halopseudomonas pachastrellae]|nr:hypothetical protein [Halopseudomonas pachastrellae]
MTNVNPLYTEREVRNQLADSGARLLIAVTCSLSAPCRWRKSWGYRC